MAHARHKAPARTSRLDSRHADAAVVIAGVAMLAVAVFGATSSASAPVPQSVVVADAGQTTMAPRTDDSDLRDEREQALLRAARGADRTATDLAAPHSAAPATPTLPATTTAYTTVAVNVRAAASQDSDVLAVLDPGAEIGVTGKAEGEYIEIVHDGRLAWVFAGYVAATPPASGVSGAPCSSGSGVESGLTANAIAVHRAVCALFPGVSGYGGLRGGGGEHSTGHAIDIMVSTDLGNEIAAYLQAHAGELGVSELLWRQRIWTTERAGDGWRWMEDRGSATANHYDHVHVTVN